MSGLSLRPHRPLLWASRLAGQDSRQHLKEQPCSPCCGPKQERSRRRGYAWQRLSKAQCQWLQSDLPSWNPMICEFTNDPINKFKTSIIQPPLNCDTSQQLRLQHMCPKGTFQIQSRTGREAFELDLGVKWNTGSVLQKGPSQINETDFNLQTKELERCFPTQWLRPNHQIYLDQLHNMCLNEGH